MSELDAFKPFSLADVLANANQINAGRERIADMQTERDDKTVERKINYHNLLGQAATNISAKMKATGLQPGTPEHQAQLDAIGKPYMDFFRSIGAPVEDGPIHWDTIAAFDGLGTNGRLSSMHQVDDGHGGATWYQAMADGTFVNTGKRVPVKNLGQGVIAAPGDGGDLVARPITGYSESATKIEEAKALGRSAGSVHTAEGPGGEKLFGTGRALGIGGAPIPVGPGAGRPPVSAEFSTADEAAWGLELARTMPAGSEEQKAVIRAAAAQLVRKGQGGVIVGPTVGEKAGAEVEAKLQAESRLAPGLEAAKESAKISAKTAGERSAESPQKIRILKNRMADIDAAIEALQPSADKTELGMPKTFGFKTGGFMGGSGNNPANSATAMEFTNNPNWRTLQRVGKGEELEKAATDMAKQGQITEGERALLMLSTGLDPAKHRSEQIYQQLMLAKARHAVLLKQWEGAGQTPVPAPTATPEPANPAQPTAKLRLKFNPATGRLE